MTLEICFVTFNKRVENGGGASGVRLYNAELQTLRWGCKLDALGPNAPVQTFLELRRVAKGTVKAAIKFYPRYTFVFVGSSAY